MTTFLDSLKGTLNATRTENGDKAYKSSTDPVVDYFGLAGAMRDRAEDTANLFEAAFRAEPEAALRTLFYLRDVRGGQGERDVFRAGLRHLWTLTPYVAGKMLKHVPVYGRWDDLFVFGDEVPADVAEIIRNQWTADVAAYERGDKVSLLAKWLPSDKSKKNPRLAINVRKALGLSQREYRHTLSALRGRIGLLEHDMTEGTYEHVDYSTLPAQAHRKHVAAFRRHDGERYQAFLDAVDRGEKKVNTSTLYPYELYDLCQRDPKAADTLWNNLPDYTRPGQDAIVLADVSGSMWGRPISVSVSLALYFAERNTGPYNGYFMTFSSVPELVQVRGKTLADKLDSIQHSTTWCGSTNLAAAFKAILAAGKKSGVVPATLYIVSDMQFDRALNHADLSVFEVAKRQFQAAGLELPHVVFWNVNARHDQLPVLSHEGNVTLVSGLAATTFGMAVEGKSPRELVDDVINSERYSQITL
ncbi:RNA-binding protein [Mycobacterium phage CicholasNage]|uniref:Ro-like RNA binding protein n=1 Tax=Mycobacterium phage CicholasNage TaxID=2500799 RepID=A0A411BPB8_9CAUD|nr:RNA-binding protein [Mycobacterium phage CicholasNage]AZS12208.1 Ro-like RNA binding protein [Mycobacterium phage Acquire49]QGJ92458.1 Ro-like RNA binding protein [Mycobacterium phage Wyatt2]QGJ93073.1 Ro-like RNA binding protein [Mycobacterium phage Zaria]QWT30581.1 Ro-like RNA binding protein [Mycobacterium phage Rose5]WMI34647.1 Ro-like RNA binding protein [Mycobacterium phage Calm]